MLKSYNEFVNEGNRSESDFKDAESLLISKKCYLKDGLWNCDGHLMLGAPHLRPLLIDKETGRLKVKFGIIKGRFTLRGPDSGRVGNPYGLQSMIGMPIEVGSNFVVAQHVIRSLEGMPKKVGGIIDISGNYISDLSGLPDSCTALNAASNTLKDLKTLKCKINGKLELDGNKITSLEGIPVEINCTELKFNNNKLTNLKGLEKISTKNYNFMDNKLTSLEGAPKEAEQFIISRNPMLSNLEHIPRIIGDNYLFHPPYGTSASETEVDWYKKIGRYGYKDYWIEVFQFAVKNHIEYISFVNWPENFIETLSDENKNLLSSSKIISKFNL